MTTSFNESVTTLATHRGWATTPLKFLFRRSKKLGDGSEQLLSIYRDHGVIPKNSRSDNFNKASDDLSKYQKVDMGDLVVNKMKAWQGSVAISDHAGIISPAYFVYRPALTAGMNTRYLHYLLRSGLFFQHYGSISTGVRPNQWDLDPAAFERTLLFRPPIASQDAIADYLDHETAEIDKLIADLQSFDTIYTERQMAQVSDLIAYPADLSTSHGCASGIVKAKYLGDIALGKMLDARQEDADSTTHPYLRAANVQPMGKLALEDIKHMRFTHREAAHLTIKGGDVLVVEGGVGGYGRAAYVSEDIPETGFQNSILRLRPNAHADGRFITYALLLLRHRGYMKMAASVTSMPHFTVDKLANTPIPLMDLTRQTEIADELDAMWQRVDAVRDEGKRAIALARQRRAALITAAVTGQIDVTARNKPAAEQLEDDIAQGLHREN
ncbi:restriction endonuclease subunit S [Kocuria sp. KSNUG]|uniref:restriction endonuclease subunit S n=1 Tax=Kocuria sp. KSNUG TaxID=3136676 RepID=UPI003C2AC586